MKNGNTSTALSARKKLVLGADPGGAASDKDPAVGIGVSLSSGRALCDIAAQLCIELTYVILEPVTELGYYFNDKF